MKYFDFLIDKNNVQPKSDMEYIYRHDMVWKSGHFGDIPIKPGTIMIDVIKLENNSYEFTCKETGERFRTNYGWSLAENTPENVKRINRLEKEQIKLKKFEKKVAELYDKVITLKSK